MAIPSSAKPCYNLSVSTQRTDSVNRQIYIINTAEAQTVCMCGALQNPCTTAIQPEGFYMPQKAFHMKKVFAL